MKLTQIFVNDESFLPPSGVAQLPANANSLKISRYFTESAKDPFDKLSSSKKDVEIRNLDGSVAFSMKDVTLPDNYSQVASNVLAQKYLRKAVELLPDDPITNDHYGDVLWQLNRTHQHYHLLA